MAYTETMRGNSWLFKIKLIKPTIKYMKHQLDKLSKKI